MSLSSGLRIKPLWLWFGIALLVLALDQVSKYWVVQAFQDDQGHALLYIEKEITPFFKITRRHNCGVAFSLGKQSRHADCRDVGAQRWILSAFVLVVSIAIAVWIARLDATKKREALGLSLILGGALGNLVDRSLLGYVVDFIVVHHSSWPWPEFPAFNVADSAITCGAGILILDMLLGHDKNSSATQKDRQGGN